MNYRHGDVILKRIDRIQDGATPLKHRILAEGEVTGHAHRLTAGDVFAHPEGGTYVVIGDDGADLTHEEHGPQHIEPGIYERIIQVEYEPGEEKYREVID